MTAEGSIRMKFLLTNDDGIDAEGLAALAEAAAPLGHAVWVAPDTHYSGCGHRVTTDRPIRVHRRAEGRWAIDGTPADCVRVALAQVAPDVDWVLSGINHGGNLGADVFHSGTVAAVREAALHGKPGIALSHYRRRNLDVDWSRAARWVHQALELLLRRPCKPGTFWNVNLPHPAVGDPEPQIVFCPLEAGPLPLVFRADGDSLVYAGNYHERQRQEGSDVAVCFAGNIAVTHLAVYG
jgi:5'-nucleotidase